MMKKNIAGLVMVGGPLCVSAVTASLPNVAFILTILFSGPVIAQIGIGLGVFITALLLGVDLNIGFILGL